MAVVTIKKLVKQFGGLVAIDNLDVEVQELSIHSIIGPNGAGKTTVFNCITGFYRPEGGDIRLDDPSVLLVRIRVLNASESNSGTASLTLSTAAKEAEQADGSMMVVDRDMAVLRGATYRGVEGQPPHQLCHTAPRPCHSSSDRQPRYERRYQSTWSYCRRLQRLPVSVRVHAPPYR